VASARSRRHPWVWLIGGFAIAIIGTVGLWFARSQDGVALRSLPEGVTAHEVQGVPVFIVRQNRQVEAFLDSAQHLANEQLWWCPIEEVFVSPFHGELFDAQGHALAGPASRDLDRVSVRVTAGDTVVVGPFTVQKGAPRDAEESSVDAAVMGAYRSWSERSAGEPTTFCQRRVVGEGNPHS
jgi:nitrite reductase/ring-hydroxylating ferredoxin subunit